MANIMNGFTPKTIALESKVFSIPIYQRLFEWDSEKIEQLLNDLLSSYQKSKDAPYYIGMLTSTASSDNYVLVDGQQRFTVLTLLGVVMKDYVSDWKKFLISKENETRLLFSARPDDQSYLESLVFPESDIKPIPNKRMKDGIDFIEKWLSENNKDKCDLTDFCRFVFENTKFFISSLPKDYEPKDLNKYFESMNATGRNLESHEIQKIFCLQKIGGTNLSEENATKIWNAVSQMDKSLLRKATYNKKKETDEELHKRYDCILKKLFSDGLNDFDIIELNDYRDTKDDETDEKGGKTIKDILPSDKKPDIHITDSSYHGMLSFSEFLLQVLYIQSDGRADEKDERFVINDFFDVQKLLETFGNFTNSWGPSDWEKFFFNLLAYRLLFDYFVIRIPRDEDGSFDLEYTDEVDEECSESNKLRQYQAMLYAGSASKSFYLWLNPYLLKLFSAYKKGEKLCSSGLLSFLKTNDNRRNPCPSIEKLTYQNAPLYYFRRLDYYLWERNLNNIKSYPDDFDPNINLFRFRRGGRSIEHLHPQNEDRQNEAWDKDDIHRFGNLCLISSSFNSTQSNDSVRIKFARVKDQFDRSSLESIKLYEMYKCAEKKEENWTTELMQKHEKEMYQILKDSYKDS